MENFRENYEFCYLFKKESFKIEVNKKGIKQNSFENTYNYV